MSSSASHCSEASREQGRYEDGGEGPERVRKVEMEHRNFLNDGTQAGGLGLRRVGAKAQGTWSLSKVDLTGSCCYGGLGPQDIL